MEREFQVDLKTRLDKFLSDHIPEYSREKIKAFIERGLVKVNGETEKKVSRTVKREDKVEIAVSEGDLAELEESSSEALVPQPIDFKVLFENKNVLVINKPGGLVVHPAYGHPDDTLMNGVVHYLQEKGEKTVNPKLVHRLDKDTSGVILISKNDSALFRLSKQFEERKVEKEYDAVVHGNFTLPEFQESTIKDLELEIEKKKSGWVLFGCKLHHSARHRKRVAVGQKGDWAVSKFKVLDCGREITSLKARLITGRTHQIRAQLSFLGFSVVGDELYSSPKQLRQAEKWFKDGPFKLRMLLHASRLSLRLPDGEKRTFKTDLPEEMKWIRRKLLKS